MITIPPLGTMNALTKFQSNPSNSCRNISVVDWLTDRPTLPFTEPKIHRSVKAAFQKMNLSFNSNSRIARNFAKLTSVCCMSVDSHTNPCWPFRSDAGKPKWISDLFKLAAWAAEWSISLSVKPLDSPRFFRKTAVADRSVHRSHTCEM